MTQETPTAPVKAKSRRSRRWVVILGLLAIGGGAFAFSARPWETRPKSVATEVMALGPVSQVLAVNGRVAAIRAVTVRSAVAGQAITVLTEEGSAVTAGDILIQLDAAQAEALVNQARAQVEAGLVKQQQAQANADRARALGDNASRATREDAELSLLAANTEVDRLRAGLEQAQSHLDQYTITAPISGVVLRRHVDRGQMVDTQAELLTIADLTQLVVETDVDELYSSRMKNGLKALLEPAGETVARPGKLIYAAPTVDPATGGRAIKIGFETPVDLPVGLTVTANIIVSETQSAVSIPRGAIVIEGTDSHVLVLVDGFAQVRRVSFLDWPAERVIVPSGLVPGDVVLLAPANIKVGQPLVGMQ